MGLAVPTRLDERLVRELDRLVSEGLYLSRSEAIREAVRRLVAERYVPLGRFLLMVAEVASEALTSGLGGVATDVVLFGSAARGDVGPDSDIDLLVLIGHGDAPAVRRRAHEIVYPISLGSAVPITVVVMSREEFLAWVREGLSFAREVVEEGVQLHGEVLYAVRGG